MYLIDKKQLSCTNVVVPKISDIILKTLESRPNPIDYQNLLEAICKQTIKPNKTTIYRALESLEKQHKIMRANVSDTKSFWEIKGDNHVHIHFICINCGTVECKPMLDNIFKIPTLNNFTTQKVEISASGLCQTCSK